MSDESTIAHREVVIVNEYGLHLRPANVFARTAMRFLSEIQVTYNGLSVNGKSIMDLMMLAAEPGGVITIHAHGPDAAVALETLCSLVESDFRSESANPSSQAI